MLTIGKRIKQAIGQAGISQKQLATFCGVSPQAVSGWVRESKIQCDHLARVAKITKTRMYWLQTGEGPMDDRAAIEEFEALRSGRIESSSTRLSRPAEVIISKLIDSVESGETTIEDLETVWALIERMNIKRPLDKKGLERHGDLSRVIHGVEPKKGE